MRQTALVNSSRNPSLSKSLPDFAPWVKSANATWWKNWGRPRFATEALSKDSAKGAGAVSCTRSSCWRHWVNSVTSAAWKISLVITAFPEAKGIDYHAYRLGGEFLKLVFRL